MMAGNPALLFCVEFEKRKLINPGKLEIIGSGPFLLFRKENANLAQSGIGDSTRRRHKQNQIPSRAFTWSHSSLIFRFSHRF